MHIIDQSSEILYMDDLERIERAGRTCYKSENKIGCAVKEPGLCSVRQDTRMRGECSITSCPDHSSNKFVRSLIKRGHEAMIEHGSATVKFITNRGVTHELVRHRLCAFGQESTRYVNYGDKEMEFIRPVWCNGTADEMNSALEDLGTRCGNDFREYVEGRLGWTPDTEWLLACYSSEQSYGYLMSECGWRPEQAREVLPNSLKTEIVVTANYREWRHIFKLRALGTTGKPHPQMQALMMPLLREFQETLPALFGDLMPTKE